MTDLLAYLRSNPYPGRGIVIGSDWVYYFIMGRSENSRNRVFVKTEDGIRTKAFDPSKLTDPSLVIYHPVRFVNGDLIVTNGDQTDTIAETGDFRAALATRTYEPDAPHWTPRISSLLRPDGSFELSILKRGPGGGCVREFFAYERVPAGVGYFLSTYAGPGEPLPSYSGEPMEIALPEPEEVWAALNADNRVALYANAGGAVTLFNKRLGD